MSIAAAIFSLLPGLIHKCRNGRAISAAPIGRNQFVERIEGYDVTYEYAGREYVTRMPYDPGERIRVRVDVTPADG